MKLLKVRLFSCIVGAMLLALLLTTAVAQAQAAPWSVVPSPSPGSENELNGVASVSANDVWAVGTVNTATPPLIEHWNGTSWRLVKAPRQAGFLNGVTAVSASDVWAVGEFINASNVNQTLIENWNGHKWSVVPSPNVSGTITDTLQAAAAVSSTDVWAVGQFVSGSNVQPQSQRERKHSESGGRPKLWPGLGRGIIFQQRPSDAHRVQSLAGARCQRGGAPPGVQEGVLPDASASRSTAPGFSPSIPGAYQESRTVSCDTMR